MHDGSCLAAIENSKVENSAKGEVSIYHGTSAEEDETENVEARLWFGMFGVGAVFSEQAFSACDVCNAFAQSSGGKVVQRSSFCQKVMLPVSFEHSRLSWALQYRSILPG